MRYFYSSQFNYGAGLPLRQVHGFVLDKPKRIRDQLVRQHGISRDIFEAPEEVGAADFLRVHTEEHWQNLDDQSFIAQAIEMPPLKWLPNFVVQKAVVTPQKRATGGTLAALRAAFAGEWAVSLSGGYHHARPALAHGFCLVNDVAVAVARLREEGEHGKVLVLDLDLHQGDGNAVAFANDPSVFTASMHERGIFPQPNMESDLDVLVESYTGDEAYLEQLEELLQAIADAFEPDVVVYVAGSDPYEGDPLGTLTLSLAGLGAGLVALPAGGYTDKSPVINAAGFAAMAALRR